MTRVPHPFTPSIDFVERRPSRWPGRVVVALLVIGVAAGVSTYERLREKDEALNAELDGLRQRGRDKHSLPIVVDKDDDARRLQRKETAAALAYPWAAVFDPLERAATVEGVGLLSLVHDQAQGSTQLTIEALDVPSALRYVESLNERDRPAQWTLTGYQLQPRTVPQTIRAQIQSGSLRSPGQ